MFGKIEDLSHSFRGRTTVMRRPNVSGWAGDNVPQMGLTHYHWALKAITPLVSHDAFIPGSEHLPHGPR